ncbi:MAG: hypothetical protein FJ020_03630 [Chloroflexi bacterium]|nr:hypothetical protein [Chloroflexota bacterium]
MVLGIVLGSIALVVIAVVLIYPSTGFIGALEVGLVRKRFGKKLPEDNPIGFEGEAGYQAGLIMPGFFFRFWPVYSVERHPWVQVPAGEIGVVIAQVGDPLPIGAKSAVYKKEFSNFTSLKAFIENGGQKGVQRPVLPPGTAAPIHPVAFLVLTRQSVYGVPILPELLNTKEELKPKHFGLTPDQLGVVVITPDASGKDMVGVVTTYEGDPLLAGDIASRIGGFGEIRALEATQGDIDIIEAVLGSKNSVHNNYQDFQTFLDSGGKIGLQHDVLLYGAYNLNPFLVSVQKVPMLVVEQGEVAVIKSYVGLPSESVTGEEFKFGTLVRPGHRGIWREPLRTGKYPINPHCYNAEVVPTAILTLNWAEARSRAHKLDANLSTILAKSREGFKFSIDLQVQIHVSDRNAPVVISMVGTMLNLVDEVLQGAVGNHFRDKLQSMPAVQFIETRQRVQEEAFEHVQTKLDQYKVETRGVYIQDVVLPEQLVNVLTAREIANQEIATYKKQQEAQQQRIQTEKSRGTADKQAELAAAEVGVSIQKNKAEQRKAEADGEAFYTERMGKAEGAKREAIGKGEGSSREAIGKGDGAAFEAIGVGKAKGYQAQQTALGQDGAVLVNTIGQLAEKNLKFVPDVMVSGGSSVDGLAGILMKYFGQKPAEKT